MENSPITSKDSTPPWERDRSRVSPPKAVNQFSTRVHKRKKKSQKPPRAENPKRRNMREFDKNYQVFKDLIVAAGLQVRGSSVTKHTVHVMVENEKGKRVLNYWPSTKQAHLASRNKYFHVQDHMDAARSAIRGEIVGAVEIKPEDKPDELTQEFLQMAAWF